MKGYLNSLYLGGSVLDSVNVLWCWVDGEGVGGVSGQYNPLSQLSVIYGCP